MDRKTIVAAFALCLSSMGAAHALETPKLASYVNDSAGLFTREQHDALAAKLKQYQEQSGHQFIFLGIPSLEGESIDEYAVNTFHAWGLGDKKRDDGLLFVIAKKERKWRIEVGYGLEGTLPDATVNRIFREQAAKPLKHDDFATGIGNAFDALIATAKAADAQSAPAPIKPQAATKRGQGLWIAGSIFGLCSAFGIGLFAWGRRARRKREEEMRRREQLRALELARQRPSVVGPYASPVAPEPEPEPPTRRMRSTPPAVIVTRRDDDDPPRRQRDSDSGVSMGGGFDSSPATGGGGDTPIGGGGDSGGGGAAGDF